MTTHHNDAQAHRFFEHGIHATRSITIVRPAQDLYAVWRNLEDLPRFVNHLESVTAIDATHSRWTTKGPIGKSFTWNAEIIRDEPGRLIAWKSVGETPVPNAGTIEFRDQGEGVTEVRVTMEYLPPGGKVGAAVAKALGDDAEAQIREGLDKFKRAMETGAAPDVVTRTNLSGTRVQ